MKFSTVFSVAFAVMASAAPASCPDKRLAIDADQLNGLTFNQVDLNYLLNINAIDLTLFQKLGLKNNLDVLVFKDLFNADTFSLGQLLQFQQLNTLLAVAGAGVFDKFDLSRLELGGLKLGLIAEIGDIELTQFIKEASNPQIQKIAKQGKWMTTNNEW